MALNCSITSGRGKACKNTVGGTKIAYLINGIEGDQPFTVNQTTGLATGINPLITEVFAFELEGDENTLVQNMPSDRNTGTTVNTQTLTLKLKKIDAETSAQMNLLAYNYPYAVVVDRNDNGHAVGIDDGIDFTIEENTGAAKSDFNGYTLTGVSTTKALAPILNADTMTALKALVSGTPSV